MAYMIVDIVPDYIKQRYPYAKDLQEAINRGEVVRDQYGNLVLAHQPPLAHTQYFPANYGFIPSQQVPMYPSNAYICQQPYYNYRPLYMAKPMIEQQMIEFDMFNIEGVRGYYKEESDGYLLKLVSAYDVAVGVGLSRIVTDKRRISATDMSVANDELGSDMSDPKYAQYDMIRWKEFNDYAQQRLPYLQGIAHPSIFNHVPSQIGNDSYIPLELAVQVAMCCRSEQAKKFQAIIAVKIADEIYNLNKERHEKVIESLQGQINMKDRQLEEQVKVTEHITNYYQKFNSTEHCFTATELAKNYGLSAQTFNKLLNKLNMIYFVNNTWQVYQKYADLGCTSIRNENGQSQTYWTENGKLVISVLLMNYGIEEGKPNQEIVDRLLCDF